MATYLNLRNLFWILFYLSISISWIALFTQISANNLVALPRALWQGLCLSAQEVDYLSLWKMWLLMAAAMMLPSFVPALRCFLDLSHANASTPREAVAMVMGYGAIWALAAAMGAGLQQILAQKALLSPLGASLSTLLTSVLFGVAGAYQFSHLKAACLAKCRMPLTFFLQRWTKGITRAFKMGTELGVICFGCCWALMLLAFVGGTMNLLWMGAATLFMSLEKLPQLGKFTTKPMGILLLGASAYTILNQLWP